MIKNFTKMENSEMFIEAKEEFLHILGIQNFPKISNDMTVKQIAKEIVALKMPKRKMYYLGLSEKVLSCMKRTVKTCDFHNYDPYEHIKKSFFLMLFDAVMEKKDEIIKYIIFDQLQTMNYVTKKTIEHIIHDLETMTYIFKNKDITVENIKETVLSYANIRNKNNYIDTKNEQNDTDFSKVKKRLIEKNSNSIYYKNKERVRAKAMRFIVDVQEGKYSEMQEQEIYVQLIDQAKLFGLKNEFKMYGLM